jgi:hypothetical protein
MAVRSGRRGVDRQLSRLRVAGAVEAPREDARGAGAGAVLALGLPRHLEARPQRRRGRQESHGRRVLRSGCSQVDGDLAGHRPATAGRVGPSEHAPAAAVLAARLPDDQKPPVAGHGHRRRLVVVGRRGVDLETLAHRLAGAVVELAEDTVGAARPLVARPDDHEVAGGVGGDRRGLPAKGGAGTADLKGRRQRSGRGAAVGLEELREDVPAAGRSRLLLPSDDEVPGRLPRHCRRSLVGRGRGGRGDLNLAACQRDLGLCRRRAEARADQEHKRLRLRKRPHRTTSPGLISPPYDEAFKAYRAAHAQSRLVW